jgi:hypothetical protein
VILELNYHGRSCVLWSSENQKPILVDRDLRAYDPWQVLYDDVQASAWVRVAAAADPNAGLDHPLVQNFLAGLH